MLAFRPDTTPAVARTHDANGLLIAFASFPAATCPSSATVAIRSGMPPRWLDAMSFDRDRMVDVPNRGKLAGATAGRWQPLWQPQGSGILSMRPLGR